MKKKVIYSVVFLLTLFVGVFFFLNNDNDTLNDFYPIKDNSDGGLTVTLENDKGERITLFKAYFDKNVQIDKKEMEKLGIKITEKNPTCTDILPTEGHEKCIEFFLDPKKISEFNKKFNPSYVRIPEM